VTGIACSLLEVCHCGCGLSPPQPQVSGEAERTRKRRLVAKCLEDVDHTFELACDFLVAQPRDRVGAEVGTRDCGVGCDQLLTRQARVFDCFRQHRFRALQLA
jgi:hypothetical protein